MTGKVLHVKVAMSGLQGRRSPIGTPFVYHSSMWRINGLYLASTRSGEREAWCILAEQPSDNQFSDEEAER